MALCVSLRARHTVFTLLHHWKDTLVVCLQLNLGTGPTGAFSLAADAALNQTLNPPFTPYENNLFFIHGAFIFEDVGVTAYQVSFPFT